MSYKSRGSYGTGGKIENGHCGTKQNTCKNLGELCLDCFKSQGNYTNYEQRESGVNNESN